MGISIPEILNTGNSEKYKLSIRLWSGGLSFSGYNPSESGSFFYGEAEYDRSKTFLSWLKDVFFENEFLGYTYASVRVLYVSAHYTLVPEDVIKGKCESAFLSFNFSATTSKGLSNALRGNKLSVIFDVPEDIYEFCARSLLNPLFVHHLSPLLTMWQKRSGLSIPKQMYVYLHRTMMDVVCYDQGTLLFSNTFTFQDSTDIIYFILYAWRQTGLDQKTDELLFYAPADLQNEILRLLSPFIYKLESIGLPSEIYLMGPGTEQAPLDLLYLSLCEL
jgi:hypothetical protein